MTLGQTAKASGPFDRALDTMIQKNHGFFQDSGTKPYPEPVCSALVQREVASHGEMVQRCNSSAPAMGDKE